MVRPALTTAVGSMSDVPQDLLAQIKKLEEIFSIDKAKLKEITAHFVKELEKGKSSSSILSTNSLIPVQA